MAITTVQSDNSKIESEPEWGKGWKAENNAGCCTTCNSEAQVASCTTVVQAFTRYSRDASLVTEITNDYCPCRDQAPIVRCIEPVKNNDTCS